MKIRIIAVHGIFCHFVWIVSPTLESERYDYVCIYIISKYPSSSFQIASYIIRLFPHNHKYLLGSAILPSIADAATVAGDARYTFDESAPILPTKILEDEDMQISFSPNAPR